MVALSLLILAGIRALLMERQQTAPMFEFQGRALVFTEITKPIEFPRYLEIGGCFHYSSGAQGRDAVDASQETQERRTGTTSWKNEGWNCLRRNTTFTTWSWPGTDRAFGVWKAYSFSNGRAGKETFQEPMQQMWESIMEFSHKQERSKFDFKARSFEWQSDDSSGWICQYQSAERRVWLDKGKFFWKTCVKREGHIGKSNYFVKLADAVLVSLFIRSVLQPI